MKKLIATLLAAVLFTSALAGCGGGGGGKETTAPANTGELVAGNEPITLRIGTMPFGHSVPVYYAIKNGMFEEANITVETLFFAGGPAMNEAAAAGEWDLGTTGGMPAVTGALAYDYKIIAYANDDMAPNAIYARPDSDIVAAGQGHVEAAPEMYGTADTWKGKTVLVNTGSSLQYGLDACLELIGLKESDLTVVQMDCASALAAFQAGEGDLCCLWDPQRYTAENEGYVKIASLNMTDEILPTCVAASSDMVKNHPDYVLRFLKVYLQAQEILANDLDLYAKTFDEIAGNVSDIADNTEEIKNNEDIADLIRDYHAQQYTQRSTTQYITIDMSGQVNNISSSMDVASITDSFVTQVREAVAVTSDGV